MAMDWIPRQVLLCIFDRLSGTGMMTIRFSPLALIVVACGLATAAHGQTQAQLDAYARMSASPTDHEATFAYVRASSEARDYEGAIAALERILQYNPNLSRAKYELGVLYFRQKSYEQAVLHFEDASADPALDPAVARRLEGFVDEARKQLSPSRFSGIFQLGYRFNSNVAAVPGSNLMRTFGYTLPVTGRPYAKRAGSSAFALGEITHIYDFETQRGDQWESRVAAYGAKQSRYSSLDVALFEANTGPRFFLSHGGISIRPYAAASGSMLGGHRYSSGAGGGVSVGIPITPYFSIEPGFDAQRVTFENFGRARGSDVYATGALWTASVNANWAVAENVTVSGKVFYQRNAADGGRISSNHAGFEASVKYDFAPPVDAIGYNWSLTPFVRYMNVDFTHPDPVVDPLIKRNDTLWRAGLQLDMPMTKYFGVSTNVQYTRNDSTFRNFRASSWSFMIGPTARF